MKRPFSFKVCDGHLGAIAWSILRQIGWKPRRLHDRRGGVVVFVPHCALNQNARVAGAAERRAGVDELIQGLLARGVGIIQMPCPELSLFGLDRSQILIRDASQNAECQTRLCALAHEIANQIAQYRSCGMDVLGILGKNGSPTCGVEQTWQKGIVPGSGIFIERLRLELETRGLPVNIAGYHDSASGQALDAVDHWLKHRRNEP